MHIEVVSASARAASQSLKVSKYITNRLSAQHIESDLLDLYALSLPMYDDAEHAENTDKLEVLKARLAHADGFVFVTPEWNGMASIALLNMFHYLDHELAHKPVMLVGVSSGRGGAYPMLQLRSMGYKNMHYVISPENIVVSHCKEALNDDSFAEDALDLYIKKRIEYALSILSGYTKALCELRASGIVDFETYPTGMSCVTITGMNTMIDQVLADALRERAKQADATVMRSVELKSLFDQIKTVAPDQKSAYGQELNALKTELQLLLAGSQVQTKTQSAIDVTAPWDVNIAAADRPQLLPSQYGSEHPLMSEIKVLTDIAYRMGFNVEQSREIDDDFHMFESLNFPAGHPARDDYDTFMTDEGLIAPAHTSTMQNRVLKKYVGNLQNGQPIAVIVPDRVFRNEDLDVTHEHTFYQYEGVYVNKGVTVGNLIATLRAFLSEYFGQELKAKIQPFYFPFTEPSFEFAIERPASLRKGTTEADMWLELLGCGMIHPNVLKHAGIDPVEYSGFAWGGGVERLVLMKYGIEDIRHFESGKLEFLRQFS